jgi:hypothetical protein
MDMLIEAETEKLTKGKIAQVAKSTAAAYYNAVNFDLMRDLAQLAAGGLTDEQIAGLAGCPVEVLKEHFFVLLHSNRRKTESLPERMRAYLERQNK